MKKVSLLAAAIVVISGSAAASPVAPTPTPKPRPDTTRPTPMGDPPGWPLPCNPCSK